MVEDGSFGGLFSNLGSAPYKEPHVSIDLNIKWSDEGRITARALRSVPFHVRFLALHAVIPDGLLLSEMQ